VHDTTQLSSESRNDGHEEHVVVGAGIDFTDPNSPLAPLYFRASHVLAAVFLACTFVFFTWLVLVFHTDVWAHLRFGQEIVRQGRLPEHEPFPESFADKEAPYVHYQWVAQAGAYLVFELGRALSAPDAGHQLGGGAMLLTTAHAAVVTLRFLLLFWAFGRLTRSPAFALAGVVLVALLGSFVHLFIIRPQILGELGFAAVLLALSRPVLSRRALVGVPLVFLVWANCHGSFVVGFLLLGAALAGRAVEVVWDRVRVPAGDGAPAGLGGTLRLAARGLAGDTAFRRLAAALALSVAATTVNPHGPYLLYNSWALSHNPNVVFMEEWKPLPVRSIQNVTFFASVVLLVPLLRLSPLRFTPTQVLLLLGFGLQSVLHARMLVWWGMVLPWVAVPHLHAVFCRYLPAWSEDRSVLSFRKTALAVLLVLALGAWSRPAWWLAYGEAPRGEERVSAVTPVKAAHYLRNEDAAARGGLVAAAALGGVVPPAGGTWAALGSVAAAEVSAKTWRRVVFASETLGDYLLWDLRLDPPIRLCCYTHVHLFTPDHWKKCMAEKLGDRHWQEILDGWGVEFLVLEHDLYEQQEHRAQGKKPGFSNLIDLVKAAPDRWRVLSDKNDLVFVAQRIRP
jgi:hypothetical protein